MAEFKPSLPYSVPIELLIPTYGREKAVDTKIYPDTGIRLNCSFKTYGGSEQQVNGIYSVVDTANVETWYRPDIKADCRIRLMETGDEFEIINRPEDINRRHQFVKFKVRAVKGGA